MTLPDKNLSKLGSLEKAKRYQRIHHQVYFLNLAVTAILLLLLVFSPLGGWIRTVSGVSGNAFLDLQIYFVIFSLIFLLFDLPLSFYSGYMVEKRFELSHHTVKSWTVDEIKKALLSFGIASLLIQLFYWLMRVDVTQWWWKAWLAYLGLSLFFSKIMPLWIIPLFYKYGEIANKALKERIQKLAQDHGLHIQNFYSLNLSRTTKKANAMFTGLGKTKRVVLADTLLENFTDDEIESVVAHEIGHFKKNHILKNLFLSTLFSGALFYGGFIYLQSRSEVTGVAAADPAFLPEILLLGWLFSVLASPFFKWISRRHEIEADDFALQSTGRKGSFITTFQKLAQMNLADPEPNPWIERLMYTHPSIAKRIKFAEDYQFSSPSS